MPVEHLVIGDGVELYGIGIGGGIAVVHAVDILGQQYHVGANLRRPQHRGGIGGEIRVAGAAAEDDHAALFQMTDGPGTDVRLCHGTDLQRCLHPHVHALLLQHVGHGHAVHGGGQHAHVVGPGTLDISLAVLHAAPEVAAADDHAHLHTHGGTFLDHVGHLAHYLEIQTEVLVAGQRLAADLQQHPFIFRFVHVLRSYASIPFYIPCYFTLFLPVCIEGKSKFCRFFYCPSAKKLIYWRREER